MTTQPCQARRSIPGPQPRAESREPRAARRLAFTLLILAGCGGDGGKTVLTVYSPHGKDLLAHYERGFEAANPTVDVQWVDMG